MIAEQQLEAVIRAGLFRDHEDAINQALHTLFAVRPHLKTEAAIELFRQGEVSLLRAAEIAGLDFVSFRQLLRDRGIPVVIEGQEAAEMDRVIEGFFAEQDMLINEKEHILQ